MGLAARDGYFARQLWAVTARDHQRFQNHIVVLGSMNARQRVAAFLLVVPCNSGDNEIELSMSRRDIGDYLGLTIETVSRTMMQFEKEAVIGVPSARSIERVLRKLLEAGRRRNGTRPSISRDRLSNSMTHSVGAIGGPKPAENMIWAALRACCDG